MVGARKDSRSIKFPLLVPLDLLLLLLLLLLSLMLNLS